MLAKKPRNERLEKAIHIEQEAFQPDPAALLIERDTLAAEQQLYERECRLVRGSPAVHRTPASATLAGRAVALRPSRRGPYRSAEYALSIRDQLRDQQRN